MHFVIVCYYVTPFINISMNFDHLFQGVEFIYNRFYLFLLNKLFKEIFFGFLFECYLNCEI